MRSNESKITCDKCGKSGKIKWIVSQFVHIGRRAETPNGWRRWKSKDVCPKCAKKIEKIIKEFLE